MVNMTFCKRECCTYVEASDLIAVDSGEAKYLQCGGTGTAAS